MKTIRQRLLGDATLDLKSVFTKARTLDLAQNSSESYSSPREAQIVATADNEVESVSAYIVRRAYGDGRKYSKCKFCGNRSHSKEGQRSTFPAEKVTCFNCKMKGHFSKMCINQTIVSATTDFTPTLAAISDIAYRDSLSAAS